MMSHVLKVVNHGVVMLQLLFESHTDHVFVGKWSVLTDFVGVEPLFIVAAVLLLLTIVTTLLYYSRIRQAAKAYEEAKNIVGDVIVSYDRQLNRQAETIGATTQKIEAQAGKSDILSKRLDEQEHRISSGLADMNMKIATLPEVESVKTTLQSLQERVEGLAKAQEEWKKRALTATESQIEAVIPLHREQALAPLTETELHVLEFIATSPSGERTAPEVKEMIKLTREHTARLMKKLYEGGYLERRADKTPFAYRVKDEMLKILKKSEAKA